MVAYNFKEIAVVPSAKDFIDVILSKTQRQTPTVVHKGYKISRIRKFYMRKIKFTQQNYHDRMQKILDQFPRLDDIHPFYADLMNILYSKDHYKLALGQLNTAKTLMDNVGKDYLKLLKFADSLYRCKELKRAALGRMCTIMKKLASSLQYLEQVRQHMSRLPSIDPNTRTLLVTGYPNVGKSSFINKVSHANVEVQPYAFTTKSLFVGHCDYKYMRWQVIDTPGILDHPLEERNTIEMQSITALAHLHCTIMFFIDLSEQCGYSIQKQVDLFHSIKPLFSNKPLLIVATKQDLRRLSDLNQQETELIQSMCKDRNSRIVEMSNISEAGINNVMTIGCDMLLAHRIEKKLKSKRVEEVINRIHIAKPVPRDNKVRSVSIPESILKARESNEEEAPRKLERDLEMEQGGPGIYRHDYRKNFDLSNPDWKFDIIPEILDGHNIADFVDPDIEAKLLELEKEEDELQRQAEQAMQDEDSESSLDEETAELAEAIRDKKKTLIAHKHANKTINTAPIPRAKRTQTVSDAVEKLRERGVDTTAFEKRARSLSRGRKRRADDESGAEMSDDDGERRGRSKIRKVDRARSESRVRDQTRARSKSPFKNPIQQAQAQKLSEVVQRAMNLDARQGESDRRYYNPKPRHLFSGKRSNGTNDRR